MSALPKLKNKDSQQAARGDLSLQKRRLADYMARYVITLGGVAIILCILAILVFISLEVYPLWKGARAELTGKHDLGNYRPELTFAPGNPRSNYPVVAVGIEQYREIGFFITKSGLFEFIYLKDGKTVKSNPLEKIPGKELTSSSTGSDDQVYALGTGDGLVLPVKVNFIVSFAQDGTRTIEPKVTEGEPITVDTVPITHIAYKDSDGGRALSAVTADGKLVFLSEQVTTTLLGEESKEESRYDLTSELNGNSITAIALDEFIENLYVGTAEGNIYHWDTSAKGTPQLIDIIDATGNQGTAITALGFLIGERSLIVTDEAGNTSTWFQVRDKNSPTGRRLREIHKLASHGAPVTAVTPSARDKGFLSADSKGNLILHYSTSERKLLETKGEGYSIKALAFAPKADGAVALDERGILYDWKIDNPHPETSFKTLFGKVWYEGYDKPEYVWQSTGGTDDFEPKFSITPLAYGTLKGTFYALLFAIPLAIFGAICVSQFMHPSLKATIKPIIEIMAALPSVVLGFLAGLWLAPLAENIVPALFLMPIVLTILTLLSVFLWRLVPKYIRTKFKDGTEFLLLVPVFLLGIQICLLLNSPVEALLLGGDYKAWLLNTLGLQFDQRNSLIVGFAMGFAVIPIIFTISEDSLSNVPKHLTSGSLALGATKWQTAIRVVLPTAAAGIFSAVMIGFGRAVGETMIVLMATGNTPIMDWSIFNGFRALSANIAVEIPEAPHGGTLYRILFLAALLLFLMTFILNTVAELVRIRLRKKFGQL